VKNVLKGQQCDTISRNEFRIKRSMMSPSPHTHNLQPPPNKNHPNKQQQPSNNKQIKKKNRNRILTSIYSFLQPISYLLFICCAVPEYDLLEWWSRVTKLNWNTVHPLMSRLIKCGPIILKFELVQTFITAWRGYKMYLWYRYFRRNGTFGDKKWDKIPSYLGTQGHVKQLTFT